MYNKITSASFRVYSNINKLLLQARFVHLSHFSKAINPYSHHEDEPSLVGAFEALVSARNIGLPASSPYKLVVEDKPEAQQLLEAAGRERPLQCSGI
jgi:hypothetical protein